MFSRMNNRDTLSPDELVKFFLSRQKRADLNKTEEDTPNGLMQEDIIVEPLEDQEKRRCVRLSSKNDYESIR